MILVDTGALYALGDRNDTHHRDATAFFRQTRGQEVLAVPGPVLTEAALLIEAQQGMQPVRALWDDVLDGVFELVAVSGETLALAREGTRRAPRSRRIDWQTLVRYRLMNVV